MVLTISWPKIMTPNSLTPLRPPPTFPSTLLTHPKTYSTLLATIKPASPSEMSLDQRGTSTSNGRCESASARRYDSQSTAGCSGSEGEFGAEKEEVGERREGRVKRSRRIQ